jgi:hypothetical protein
MTGSSLDAANHVGAPPQVVVKEIAREKSSSTITVAPASINIYKFQLEPHRFQLEP